MHANMVANVVAEKDHTHFGSINGSRLEWHTIYPWWLPQVIATFIFVILNHVHCLE